MGCKTLFLICGWLTAGVAQAAAPTAVLTIADGEVTVLRGRVRWVLAEGQRLEPMDVVQTRSDARVARLEFNDGSVLDLGPATQVLLQPDGPAWPKDRAATAYLAQGWAKLRTAAATANGGQRPAGLASAAIDLAAPGGAVVLVHVEGRAAFGFVEAGRAQLVEHRAAREPRMFELGEGHAYTRNDLASAGSASLRATQAQLREAPRSLADMLPRRAAEWSQRTAPAIADAQTVAAREMPSWLDSEPALRQKLRLRPAAPVRTAAAARAKSARTATLAFNRLVPGASVARAAASAPLERDRQPLLATISTLPPAVMAPTAPAPKTRVATSARSIAALNP